VKAETQSFYEVAVRKAVERVLGGLDEALDLQRLAREAALSPFHFHRIFRGMLGETPLELHRRLRLERAALCLRDQNTPVTSVTANAVTSMAVTTATPRWRKAFAATACAR